MKQTLNHKRNLLLSKKYPQGHWKKISMCLKTIKRRLSKFSMVGSNICSAICWTCFPLHNFNRTCSTIHTTHSVLVFQQGPFLCRFSKWVYLVSCNWSQLPGSHSFIQNFLMDSNEEGLDFVMFSLNCLGIYDTFLGWNIAMS